VSEGAMEGARKRGNKGARGRRSREQGGKAGQRR
jgi:hypothetical protein